jgi:hypothetical protein
MNPAAHLFLTPPPLHFQLNFPLAARPATIAFNRAVRAPP